MSLTFAIIWLAQVFVAGCIGRWRGRWGLGVVLGGLLGVIGIVIILLVPKNYDNLARQEADALQRAERERQLREAARARQQIR